MNIEDLEGKYLVHKVSDIIYLAIHVDNHSKVVHVIRLEDGIKLLIEYKSLRLFYMFCLQSEDRFIFLEHECIFRKISVTKDGELRIEVFNMTRQHEDIINLDLLLDNNYNYEYV